LRLLPWRDNRPADEVAAGGYELLRDLSRIVDLECQPHTSPDRLTYLDAVDHLGVGRREHLERGATGVEYCPASVGVLPGLDQA